MIPQEKDIPIGAYNSNWPLCRARLRENSEIDAAQVRLIDADNNMVGVVALREAMQAAEKAGLVLVEVSPRASPPVCRVLDHGEYRKLVRQRSDEAQKALTELAFDEIRLRPDMDDRCYEIKVGIARRMISEGNKVIVTYAPRGRGPDFSAEGERALIQFRNTLKEYAPLSTPPEMEGRRMIMVLASR